MNAPVDIARIVREIPRPCICDWLPPDYRRPPFERGWVLPVADPACRIHGPKNGDQE